MKVEHWRAGKKYFSVIFHYYISSLPLRKMWCGKVSDVLDSKRKKEVWDGENKRVSLEWFSVAFFLFQAGTYFTLPIFQKWCHPIVIGGNCVRQIRSDAANKKGSSEARNGRTEEGEEFDHKKNLLLISTPPKCIAMMQ